MKELHCTGNVEDGVLKISHRRDFDAAVRALDYRGPFSATFTFGATRKQSQNRYYWLMNNYIAKQLEIQQWGGWTPDDVHENNKLYCNSKTVTRVTSKGEIIDEDIAQTTTKLTVGTFSEYIEKVKIYWAGQGITVPDTFEE